MAKDKKTPSDVSKMIKDREVKLVDFKFTDLPGTWQHFTTTLTEYNEDIFTDGLGFDGSSIRGWKVINASDMLVIPDPATAWVDIFNAEPTFSMTCAFRRPRIPPFIRSRAPKRIGTVRAKNFPISVTRSAQRKVIFRCRQPTPCRTFAMKCVSSWRRRACRSSANTTKSRPRVRLRSTFVSPR